MKWILICSLFLNIILAGLYAFKNPVAPEAIVIERVKPQIVEKLVYQERSQSLSPVKKVKPENQNTAEESRSTVADFEERFERLKDDREEMLFRLGFSSQDVQRVDEIKEKYNQKYLEVIPVDQGPDLTFEQRRRIIDIDEGREKEFQKVFGQKRWETFRRSQQDYNKKQFDEVRSTDKVFVPLEI